MIEITFPDAVRHEKDFFGRQGERRRIEDALLSDARRLAFVIGERRIGKTSFQNVTTKDQPFVAVYLPVPPAIRSFQDYVRDLLVGLSSALGKSRQETGLYDHNDRFLNPSVGEAIEATRRILAGNTRLRVVAIIDEFDGHLRNCSAPHEAENILGFNKHLVERRPTEPHASITLYPSLTRLPEEDEARFGSLLISKGEVVELLPLTADETEEMVEGLLKGEAAMTTEATELFYHLSGGHPYVAKLLLTHLLPGYPRLTAHVQITPTMVEDAIQPAATDLHPHRALMNIWKMHFSPEERQIMLLLSVRDVGLTRSEAMRLSPEQRRAAKVLAKRGYLHQDGDETWGLRIGFWRYWLREWEDFEIERKRLHLDHLIEALSRPPEYSLPIIVVDPQKGKVHVNGHPIHVAPQEFRFFVCCARQSGFLVTYDQLIDVVWKDDRPEGVSLDAVYMLIRRVRLRLNDYADCLETITDLGVILHKALLKT
jgi:hypothetical protein